MTMILTCLTKDYVVQASDRRLTYRDGRKREQNNKALVYRNRFAFAFTGLAELPIQINGKITYESTIDWTAARLSEGKDLNDAVEHLKNRLTELMNTNLARKIPEESRKLALVGVGFEEVDEAGQMVRKPRRIVISNFLENDGTMLKYLSNRFSIDPYRPEEDRYVSLDVKGQQLSEQRQIELIKTLKGCIQRQMHETIGSLLSDEIKAVSKGGNRLVGEDVMCTFVPRAFVDNDGLVHVGTLQLNPPVQSAERQMLGAAENVPDRERFVIFGPFDSPRCFYVPGSKDPLLLTNVIYVSPGRVIPAINVSDVSITITPQL